MSIITIIIAVLALITVVAYFKQLSPIQRAKQASVIRDVSAMSVVATAAFAGLLLAVLKSGGVKGMLTSIIQSALSL